MNALKTRKGQPTSEREVVVYKLRDISDSMVSAWKHYFKEYPDTVEVSNGDIFKGGPTADAIVSPANSFGFMDGGIDMYYSIHFGWQMQDRLQQVLNKEKDGELLVGDAVIIRAYENDEAEQKICAKEVPELSIFNEGRPIKYLISAPTMRVPQDVRQTVNAYLAFRAVVLAVQRHNADSSKMPITTVLCPGLGTAVGRMSKPQCAKQMLAAYETFELGMHKERREPQSLHDMYMDEENMKEVPGNF
ncbi:uncharacterized protein [Littorina saxatilis]|uniref:uncharacterized protein n=1 Tax=Littorina saxatilis TaxID=31220 RepID=UPI0038B652AD